HAEEEHQRAEKPAYLTGVPRQRPEVDLVTERALVVRRVSKDIAAVRIEKQHCARIGMRRIVSDCENLDGVVGLGWKMQERFPGIRNERLGSLPVRLHRQALGALNGPRSWLFLG